jgi:hypothetical protein
MGTAASSNLPVPNELSDQDDAEPRSPASDGSLGIGSLKEGGRHE